ncbi:hypothetical protein GCM10017779_28510 [Streptomyces capillispiralis]|nr:hypothetical protein GCM10017779_28510 [Streptomyces capillispiralis]
MPPDLPLPATAPPPDLTGAEAPAGPSGARRLPGAAHVRGRRRPAGTPAPETAGGGRDRAFPA